MTKWTEVAAEARGAVALAVCVVAGGCSGNHQSMVPQAAAYVPDVPIPSGYRMVDKESLDVMAGANRVVQHVYRGRGRALDVRNFYEAQMPTAGWIRRVVQNNNGHYNLQFEKQGELCSIDVMPSRAGFFGGTIIRIAIVPRTYGGDVARSVNYGEPTARTNMSDRYATEGSFRP